MAESCRDVGEFCLEGCARIAGHLGVDELVHAGEHVVCDVGRQKVPDRTQYGAVDGFHRDLHFVGAHARATQIVTGARVRPPLRVRVRTCKPPLHHAHRARPGRRYQP